MEYVSDIINIEEKKIDEQAIMFLFEREDGSCNALLVEDNEEIVYWREVKKELEGGNL